MKRLIIGLVLGCIIIFQNCATFRPSPTLKRYAHLDKETQKLYEKVQNFIDQSQKKKLPVEIPALMKIDTLLLDKTSRKVTVHLSQALANIPFREKNTTAIYESIRKNLGGKYKDYDLKIFTRKQAIEDLIPNYYRSDTTKYDRTRMPRKDERSAALVRQLNRPWQPTQGLQNRNIALWHSHGWYYEPKLNRWEWQRARIFQVVEDLYTMSYTVPYLAPMLENAGALVYFPRERDIQSHEVIIDNDNSYPDALYSELAWDEKAWQDGEAAGFGIGQPPYHTGENPFQQGTYRKILSDAKGNAQVEWIPTIPETGDYAVYISFSASSQNVTDAHYSVHHAGGTTSFSINQQIGGSTWIYLGKFKFQAGQHPETGKVVLTNQSPEANKWVTADAVRFGGGMGNIVRHDQTSGRPRFVEGARYYLQYAGMPDSLVYDFTPQEDDYKDDYQSRGEWANYLKGAPFGPNKNRKIPGLGIPIDLSMAFHTDAGYTRNDTVIGTLMIFSTQGADTTTFFPDGMSRLANRDFGDILQTQLVEDIQTKYDPVWRRRYLWDRPYSEAFRPNMPAALLELLSHQNFLDMKFGLDPRFRFDVSRSIYKAMLKFIATQYQFEYVIQPLPVSHFQASFSGEKQVMLKWQPVLDPLEKSAIPEKYIIYTRIDSNDFDAGVLVDKPEIVINALKPGIIYSYKVTAVNAGGESFPSEILAVCWQNTTRPPVLIVNGFDRIAPPATLECDSLLGFVDSWDQGVPDRYDLCYIGSQYNFNSKSNWLDDDAPGHGASWGNFETQIIPGNSFDFPYLHGKSIHAAGFSFISTSDEAVWDKQIDILQFRLIDLILGEEKLTNWPKPVAEKQFEAFPKKLQSQLSSFVTNGGNLFISGAYIGTDLFDRNPVDSVNIRFAKKTLGFRWRTNYAVQTGGLWSCDSTLLPFGNSLKFNTNYHPGIYAVEAPDAIEPADRFSRTVLRYSESNMSAGVAYQGPYRGVCFGFPFETILGQKKRDEVMKGILNFLSSKR
ncbi:fibronectin type III domain-containing protein [candidate division KSB1 bacterium]|nr:fibronectin type III domain-containing protein [candidate division KSB1 bacterium]